jgi:hypothetical protein
MYTIGSAASVARVNKVTILTEPKIAYQAFVAVCDPAMSRALFEFSTTDDSNKHWIDSSMNTKLGGTRHGREF